MLKIFSNDYKVTGKHSTMLSELVQNNFFEYYWQICMVAPLVGFFYQHKGQIDKNNDIKPSTIFLNQLTPRYEDFDFIYRLILLADEHYCESAQERIDKAFRTIYQENTQDDEKIFQEYLLGGVEKLYEKLVLDDTKSDDSDISLPQNFRNLGNFIEEIKINNVSDNSDKIF